MPLEELVLRPQPGPQENFLASCADIVIYGGSAGGGKSFALLLEPLRHVTTNKSFVAALFRRTLADAKKPGSTWDQSTKLYSPLRAKPHLNNLTWQFSDGGKIVIGHLEHENTVNDWQGSEIPLIEFDELTHFSKSQFFYMLSRNRSLCGVHPYIRATCNPDVNSWVADFISWWIGEDGYAIPERSGVLRYFVRDGDALIWSDDRNSLIDKYGAECAPKSLTFIPSSVYDNKILLSRDPGYLANLKALPLVERGRLLDGNWKIRPAPGLYFRREWCEVVDILPNTLDYVRYYDLAATKKTDTNDPDFTVGVKMGKCRATGNYYVAHVVRMREDPFTISQMIRNTASQDGKGVRIRLPQDPGQAGKSQAAQFIKLLDGFSVDARPETGDKVTRFGPVSSQCRAGNVKFLRGAWNDDFFTALEGFGAVKNHDDDADALAGAYTMFSESNTGLIEYYKRENERCQQFNVRA